MRPPYPDEVVDAMRHSIPKGLELEPVDDEQFNEFLRLSSTTCGALWRELRALGDEGLAIAECRLKHNYYCGANQIQRKANGADFSPFSIEYFGAEASAWLVVCRFLLWKLYDRSAIWPYKQL